MPAMGALSVSGTTTLHIAGTGNVAMESTLTRSTITGKRGNGYASRATTSIPCLTGRRDSVV